MRLSRTSRRTPGPPPLALGAGALLLALVAPRSAAAVQEEQRPNPWQATAELTFTDASGNQNLSISTTGFRLRHRNPQSLAMDLRLQARYGSSEEGGERKRVAESESVRTEEGGETTRSARWSLRLQGIRDLGEGMTLEHSAQYQPVHGAVNDYLLLLETTLTVMLTQRLALSLSHEYDRDGTPPEGVHRDDRLLEAGVMIQL